MSMSISSLSGEFWLEISPYSRNRYSCALSREDSRILSSYFLEAAALVERRVGGSSHGLIWAPAFDSGRLVSSGWCVRVSTEESTVRIELVSLARRHYSDSVHPVGRSS
jgi:hypothetical protein